MFHLGMLNELANTDCKMETEMRTQLQKSTGRDQRSKEGCKRCLKMCNSFPCVILCVTTALKMDKLQSIFYQPSHLWKGCKAIKKPRELSKEKPKVIKQWLRQALWQVHTPPLKPVHRPHSEVTILNEMHQFDLLYMPSNTLYRNKNKYILSRINIASRYKIAGPIRMKQAKDIANIYINMTFTRLVLSPIPKYSSATMVMSSSLESSSCWRSKE